MAHIPRDTELQERWGHQIAPGQKHPLPALEKSSHLLDIHQLPLVIAGSRILRIALGGPALEPAI